MNIEHHRHQSRDREFVPENVWTWLSHCLTKDLPLIFMECLWAFNFSESCDTSLRASLFIDMCCVGNVQYWFKEPPSIVPERTGLETQLCISILFYWPKSKVSKQRSEHSTYLHEEICNDMQLMSVLYSSSLIPRDLTLLVQLTRDVLKLLATCQSFMICSKCDHIILYILLAKQNTRYQFAGEKQAAVAEAVQTWTSRHFIVIQSNLLMS